MRPVLLIRRGQLMWAREDLNLHGLAATSTSSLRVYQFHHSPRRLNLKKPSLFDDFFFQALLIGTTQEIKFRALHLGLFFDFNFGDCR